MKNKIVFIIIFAAVSAAGIIAMIFFMQKGVKGIPAVNPAAELITESQSKKESEKLTVQPEKENQKLTLMDTAYFSFVIPDGWQEADASNTLPIMITDSREKLTNNQAKEMNFRTNISINSAELGEILFKDYVEDTKTRLIQAIPIIEITKEEGYTINGKNAHSMEIKSVQNDLKFNTIVILAVGKDNTVWAFSFNTLEESWLDYKDIFSNMIKSIKMK
ncbi:MAG: PsbP-related protein [bacterium]|nr:PsbP-related protein [bacterium]